MIQKVRQYINNNKLLSTNSIIVVGFSGGADSVALLHTLTSIGYECIAAHCNFHLRDEESNRDATFVQSFCQKHSIPLHTIDFDTKTHAIQKSISIEMAARELRYSWFEELRQSLNATHIAVAHHQDDSVETILLNLTRGTGIRGLIGIPLRNGNIVRPLLSNTRSEILEYIKTKNLSFVEDRTNKEDIYTRNKIRLNIIPLLETINPSAKASIVRTAEHLQQVENIYNTYILNAKKEILIGNNIYIEKLLTHIEPKAILFEILYPYGFNSATIEQIFKSLKGLSGKNFYSDTYKIVKDRETLIITRINENKTSEKFTIESDSTNLSHPISLNIETTENTNSIIKNKNILFLDKQRISFPLILRKWKQGDWFTPFGMKGKKKISDYFSDNKFSLIDKESTWLLCDNEDNIIWIIGHRSDERYRVTKSSSILLKITLS